MGTAAGTPVIAVVGPSGVGKDTVINALCATAPGLERQRRVITRAVDANGEDFDAVSEEAFARMEDEGRFALSWQAHGLHYGVPVEIEVQRDHATGVVVNLSRTVLAEAQARFASLRVISLTARPEVLAARLGARGRESQADQVRRLDRAGHRLPEGLACVHEIDNSGTLNATVQAVLAALAPERG